MVYKIFFLVALAIEACSPSTYQFYANIDWRHPLTVNLVTGGLALLGTTVLGVVSYLKFRSDSARSLRKDVILECADSLTDLNTALNEISRLPYEQTIEAVTKADRGLVKLQLVGGDGIATECMEYTDRLVEFFRDISDLKNEDWSLSRQIKNGIDLADNYYEMGTQLNARASEAPANMESAVIFQRANGNLELASRERKKVSELMTKRDAVRDDIEKKFKPWALKSELQLNKMKRLARRDLSPSFQVSQFSKSNYEKKLDERDESIRLELTELEKNADQNGEAQPEQGGASS